MKLGESCKKISSWNKNPLTPIQLSIDKLRKIHKVDKNEKNNFEKIWKS